MASYADYFKENRYQPKYFLGDRVSGKWNKIPFTGSVGNDTLVSEDEGPRTSIFLDLPIKFKNTWHTIVFVSNKQLKKLKPI